MRNLLLLLLVLLTAALPVRAEEPPAIINWFDPPGWLSDQQPPRANATLSLAVTLNGRDNTRLFLAEDWAAILWPTGGATIYDYRLHAVVASGSHAETTGHPLGQEPLSRLDQLRGAAASVFTNADACVAETTFGLALSTGAFRDDARLDRNENSMSVVCGGRVVSSLELSKDTAALATLWPTLANELHLHPRLAVELSALKLSPRTISTLAHDGQLHEVFSLQDADPVSTPYPLGQHFKASPHWTFIDEEVEALVKEFVAGKVAGTKPAGGFPEALAKTQLLAEQLPALVDRVRSAPRDPGFWMDLSDYYTTQEKPHGALALAALAYNLPGGSEDERVKLWLARLREVEVLAPQFFLP